MSLGGWRAGHAPPADGEPTTSITTLRRAAGCADRIGWLKAAIRAILPYLPPQVAAMVRLQDLTGARPQDVVAIRPRAGDVWLYRPRSHKTAHQDRGKVIVLGPRAREVLRPWLERDPETCCFVPAETSAWNYRGCGAGNHW